MKMVLDEVNEIIVRYGLKPLTYDDIMEYEMTIPQNMPDARESFRRLWQRITEMEARDQR